MKIKCKLIFILIFTIVFLFYKTDPIVAMANEEPEQSMKSVAEPDVEQNAESGAESDVEQSAESGVKSDAEQSVESIGGVYAEQNAEPAAESESEQNIETASALNYTPDLVSSGTALLEWLEAHKDIGGTVKLADHVVLHEDYCYCPSGMNRPAVFVDTDIYTITVTAEIELMSDNHLIFSGQPDGKSIFYVAPKGMLSLMGIAVESGQCALWQEEGAGLVIDDDCHISGSIHYADTPFILDQDTVCFVVEKGQTLDDVLPTQIMCTVNRQGNVSHHESVPISWNLEGTEKLQEERTRFQMQGSYLYALSAEPALCTVAYNDYPLTFTDVRATAGGRWYSFRGGYTKPEAYLPITVMSEYSFDGDNWLLFDEAIVSDPDAAFYIAYEAGQCDRAVYPNIYIRLHWDHNGTGYYSNVLCYAADSLEYVGEIGGSRGGGTSIVNPPDDPQGSGDTAVTENRSADDTAEHGSGSGSAESKAPSDTNQPEGGSSASGSAAANAGLSSKAGQPLCAESKADNAGQSADAEQKAGSAGRSADAEQKAGKAGQSADTEQKPGSAGQSADAEQKAGKAGQSADEETKSESSLREMNALSDRPSKTNEQMLRTDIRESNVMFIATGFVLLSSIAGIVGFCVHSRSGTNR